MRTQPCEASWPIEEYSLGSMPWMPAPPSKDMKRAFSGSPRARRDDGPGERARPRFLGHVPRRVDLLPFDVVQAGGRFQPFHADGDFVGAGQFQVVVEAQPEGRAVDDDVGRVLARQLGRRDLRLDDVRRHGHRARRVRWPRARARCDRPAGRCRRSCRSRRRPRVSPPAPAATVASRGARLTLARTFAVRPRTAECE